MDMLWQTSTQSHCHRIVKYFKQRHQLHVFPPGQFAESAEEVGPCSSHMNGPCLVKFEQMQLEPHQVNAWLHGSFMERPLCRLYWLQRSIPAEPDKQSLFKAIVAAGLPEGLTAVRLDAYPKSEELQHGIDLEAAGYCTPMHPSAYSHVLFLVHMPDTGLWRWSYMERSQLWRHPPDQPARFSKSVATAINKIAEAMQVLGLAQQPPVPEAHMQHTNGLAAPQGTPQGQQQPAEQALTQQLQRLQLCPQQDCKAASIPQPAAAAAAATGLQAAQNQQPEQQQQQPVKWAIDVGACPGGWTSYLADSCGYSVIAIDPAQLHPDVVARPGVHFIKARAADALDEMEEILQGGQADLLVCDANDHVVCLPKFLGPVLPKLRTGGWVVLTLKFHGRGLKNDDLPARLAHLLPELEQGTALWLMANTLCERTYVARKL